MGFREEQISVEDDQRKLNIPKTIITYAIILFCGLIIYFVGICFVYILCFIFDLIITPSPSLTNFTLNNVNIYTFNFSNATSTLTSNIQITVSCKTVIEGIHLDEMDVYASYEGQTITLPTMISPTFMPDPLDDVVWSLYLNGTEVPVPPSIASSLIKDKAAGTVPIDFMFTARLRSKVDYVTVKNRLEVDCLSYVMFGNNRNDTNVIGSAVKHPLEDEGCYEV
ncbi:hypothetical protein QVD17_13217 [Tagetes erecta]|uniref:Late embryogenesis abundant protein LEA-2 subgroup domain-containing protein n=1 Tax=Tagetes erecta TaxID=13708 RepID=A0AAD8NW00_TARER|nr:hypothetical protein QVD17_13217 [Tagetes erecta]